VDDFRQLIDLDQATSDDTVTLARTAAEAIRGLNWLTGHETGLGQPSAAYDVIGAWPWQPPASGRHSPRSPAGSTRHWQPDGSATTSARTPPKPSTPPGSSSAAPACPPPPSPRT